MIASQLRGVAAEEAGRAALVLTLAALISDDLSPLDGDQQRRLWHAIPR